MKISHIIVVSLFAVSLWGCMGAKNERGFKIYGTVAGVPDATVLYYRLSDGDKLYTRDSVLLQNGQFELEGSLEYPRMVFLQVGQSNKMINIFAENTTMEITADINDLEETVVRGSQTHDQLLAFQERMKPYEGEYKDIIDRYREASENQDVVTVARLDEAYNALWERQEESIVEFISDKGNSFLTPYIIRRQLSYQLEGPELAEMISKIEPAVRVSRDYIQLAQRADVLNRVAIGKKAPDFTLEDPQGNPVSLSSLQGKYVLIDFWASWCAPCRRENPNVVRLYNVFQDQGFEILGVSLDEDRDRWIQAIEQDNLAWQHVSDLRGWGSTAGKLYGVNSIPHTVLLDPEGVIVSKNLRGDALYEKLDALLNAAGDV